MKSIKEEKRHDGVSCRLYNAQIIGNEGCWRLHPEQTADLEMLWPHLEFLSFLHFLKNTSTPSATVEVLHASLLCRILGTMIAVTK